MKFFPLIWAALWRRTPRTILTMLSIVVAFLLYGLLQGVVKGFSVGVEVSGADRLVTAGKYSLTQMNPISYVNQIQSIDGVKRVAFASWFGGIYQDEKNFFAQYPTDPESYLQVYPELLLPEDQKQAFLNTRTGAIVSKSLANRYGWELGDKVPILSTIWPMEGGSKAWEFDLVGIFDAKDAAARALHEYLLFHNDYFDEARSFGRGFVGWFITQVDDPARSAEVGRAIDTLFANSQYPTKTDSEKAFNQGFIKQFGNLELLMASIMGAVIFTLLMLTGNTMMQSVRERIPELAVLKTLGFSDNGVLWLVLAESGAMCLFAAVVGLGLATFIAPGVGQSIPGFGGMEVSGVAFVQGLLIAVVLALVVGLLPALRARRLDIVTALMGH